MTASVTPELAELYQELVSYPGGLQIRRPGVAVPLQLRRADDELSLISTVTTFGTPLDVTAAAASRPSCPRTPRRRRRSGAGSQQARRPTTPIMSDD